MESDYRNALTFKTVAFRWSVSEDIIAEHQHFIGGTICPTRFGSLVERLV